MLIASSALTYLLFSTAFAATAQGTVAIPNPKLGQIIYWSHQAKDATGECTHYWYEIFEVAQIQNDTVKVIKKGAKSNEGKVAEDLSWTPKVSYTPVKDFKAFPSEDAVVAFTDQFEKGDGCYLKMKFEGKVTK
ncbi:hypothetical protein [Thiocystis violascens]|uniref:hypothetical protein n=1 Tax=Thiocystis violascens TaxID=73141 RepID=UPI0012F6A303|nr:hypothetical protein [Thiocystis violascens]